MTFFKTILAMACVCATLHATAQAPIPAPDQPPTLSGRTLRWTTQGQTQEVTLPCDGQALLVKGTEAYVACGAQGLLVVSLQDASAQIRTQHVDGQVVGFFEVDGQIWLKVAKLSAHPLSETFAVEPGPAVITATTATTAKTPVETPTPIEPEPPILGSVLENNLDTVIIDLGEANGLKQGDHVEVFTIDTRTLGQGNTTRVERRVMIGEITAVTGDRSEVALGINEEIPPLSRVRPTSEPLTASMIRPRRADDLWEVSATIRPFLALGTIGAGSVSDVSVGYRFVSPLHLAVYLEPLSFGFADSGNVLAVAGNAFAAYDTHYFEIGLGLGWSAINDTPSTYYYDSATRTGSEVVFDRVRSGLSIGQIVRLGSRDGLHLEVRNGFLLVRDEFDYGGTVGRIQIPLAERWWLMMQGGGGSAGYVYGELGLRILTHGNGERKSVFLTASVGGAEVWGEEEITCTYDNTQTCIDTINYGGPMVGFGVEWRP